MRPLPQMLDELWPVDVLRMRHDSILRSSDFHWSDEEACRRWAQHLSMRPALRDAYVELRGPLGAGKTTFVRHLLRALGVQGRIKSPSFAVLEPHQAPGLAAISHFDFYRFSDPREWEDAGFRDVFAAPGLKLAEWPEKAEGVLPTPDLRLTIEPIDEQQRQVRAEACTARGVELLR